eukprot:577577-Prymnesium_polylepis.1
MKVAELRAVCESKGLSTSGLKPDLQKRLKEWLRGEASDSEEDETERYDVLKIHAHRVVDRQLQYQVEWKGYPDEEYTWEPVCAAACPIAPLKLSPTCYPVPHLVTAVHSICRTENRRRRISTIAVTSCTHTTATLSTVRPAVSTGIASASA